MIVIVKRIIEIEFNIKNKIDLQKYNKECKNILHIFFKTLSRCLKMFCPNNKPREQLYL